MQAHLRARNPKVTPARVVSGPTLFTGICFCADCGGAIDAQDRQGRGYLYYTCSIKARPGETGCKGRSISMEKLDDLVPDHIEDWLLQPERLEEVLASVLDRRPERAERRCEHIAELHQRAAEADLRLMRLYDAIESNGHQTIPPAMVRKFAATARERIRIADGGYRRDHLRTLAQRVEVTDGEVRIIGSKSNLLHALAAASGARPATFAVSSSVPKWRPLPDSNRCCRRERAVS